MVTEDLEMQNLTEEKKQAYLVELSNSRYTQKHGVHVNNAATSRDVLKTVDKIQHEVCSFLLSIFIKIYSLILYMIEWESTHCSSSSAGTLMI